MRTNTFISKTCISDPEIISGLKSGDRQKENAILTALYREYEEMGYKVLNDYRLEKSLYSEIMTDSMIILYENIVRGKFKAESKISTYFYSILRNKCYDYRARMNSGIPFPVEDFSDELLASPSITQFEAFEMKERLSAAVNSLRDLCRKLLTLSFYNGASNSEILAEIKEISSADSLKSQKYKCLKSLIAAIKKDRELYFALKELTE